MTLSRDTLEAALYALNRRRGELRRRRAQFTADALDQATPRALDLELDRLGAAHAELAAELELLKKSPKSLDTVRSWADTIHPRRSVPGHTHRP